MRITKQQEINRLNYELNIARDQIARLTRNLDELKNSREERKLQMQEKIAYAIG